MEPFRLEKSVWDERDFASMGWHDATVWAMVANPARFEFLLDLDYIFIWTAPQSGEGSYQFWVAPVTMVFENAHAISVDLSSASGTVQVAQLYRDAPRAAASAQLSEYRYCFECQEGEIALRATGFKLYVRKQPELLQTQRFSFDQRQGVSFERGGYSG